MHKHSQGRGKDARTHSHLPRCGGLSKPLFSSRPYSCLGARTCTHADTLSGVGMHTLRAHVPGSPNPALSTCTEMENSNQRDSCRNQPGLADFSQAPLLSPLEWQPQEGGGCYM